MIEFVYEYDEFINSCLLLALFYHADYLQLCCTRNFRVAVHGTTIHTHRYRFPSPCYTFCVSANSLHLLA